MKKSAPIRPDLNPQATPRATWLNHSVTVNTIINAHAPHESCIALDGSYVHGDCPSTR